MRIAALLREPGLTGIDVNGADRVLAHRRIVEQKAMIRDVFTELHRLMLDLEARHLSGEGMRLEIGAGAWPIQLTDPRVLATDVVPAPHLDRLIDAQAMDLPDASVKVVFGQHCFHHIPEPERFLAELERVLKPDGGAILIEPYWSPVAAFMFRRMFAEEYFDTQAPDWRTVQSGTMEGANQALSYIVFERDRARFEKLFPGLEIVHQEAIRNYLRYLLSGGINFRQLVPGMLTGPLKAAEFALSPLNRWLALHHVVVLRRK